MRHEELPREVGNWVEGDRFWDREDELRRLQELLTEGANVLIAAPRRTGKTSLMREAGRLLTGRFTCVQVDVQGARSFGEAVAEIAVATQEHLGLWRRTKEAFAGPLRLAVDRLEEIAAYDFKIRLREAAELGWRDRADQLFAVLAAMSPPVIVFIDELPILINRLLKSDDFRIVPERVKEVDAFLSWLRHITIKHRGRLRLVIAGSIGLEPVLRQAKLSATINSFTPFELGPWEPAVAIDCLKALARNYQLDLRPDAARAMVDLLGSAVPHHVQLFFSHVLDAARSGKVMVATRLDVDRIYQQRMLSTRGHVELRHMEDRLQMVLGPELMPLALDLLTEASVVGELTREACLQLEKDGATSGPYPAAALSTVIGILEHDGYLELHKESHRFVSLLLRDWWRARFQLSYVPVSRRGAR